MFELEALVQHHFDVFSNMYVVLPNPESVLKRTEPVKASPHPVQTSTNSVQTGADFVHPSSISRSQEPALARINSVEVSPDCSSAGLIWNKLTQTCLKSVKFAQKSAR